MSYRLHTADLSPFGQRAKLALSAKGLLGETQINNTFGGTDALADLAPMKQIPVLEHDGQIYPESQIIVDYLEDVVPGPALLPEDAPTRALVRLLARITDLHIAPHFMTLIIGMRPPPRPTDMAIAIEKLNTGLSYAEHYLPADGTYAFGSQLSQADIALAPFLFFVPLLADWHGAAAFPASPKCAAYLRAVSKDVHIAKAFTEMENAYKARIDSLKS